MSEPRPTLQVERITKRFPGVVALREVSFDLHEGEIHALCGENGAGKSTLIKTLSGIHPHGSFEGVMRVEGQEVRFRHLQDAEDAGIAVIYQELALVPELSVAENLFLGQEPLTRWGWIDAMTMEKLAREKLAEFGLQLDPRTRVAHLGVGQQQLVEIVKALMKRSRILILDEPTAALSESEAEILKRVVKDLRRSGVSCIYISHRLDEVFELADRITVLRDGSSVGTMTREEATREELIRRMVGREIVDLYPRRKGEQGGVLLEVKELTVSPGHGLPPRLQGIELQVHAGEVLGIGGLMGAGRSELLMHLFGVWGERQSGEVWLLGEKLEPALSAGEILRRGIGLVSEDRKHYGLVLDRAIGFNLSLSSLESLAGGGIGLVDVEKETDWNRKQFDELGVKAPGLHTRVGGLSGGNQQKVVLGKLLMTGPKVLLLDEPTRGIDVGAKVEVYELINRLTQSGCAVVLVSSDLPELLGMSDRVLVLHEGRVTGEFSREGVTPEKFLAAAMGGDARDAENRQATR